MSRSLSSALIVLALLLASAASEAGRPRTVLDQETGATLVLSTEPWIFARDQPALAAHARDYVGLYAVEINTAGKRDHFIAAFFWSTIDRRKEFAGAMPRMDLVVDDRRVQLLPRAESPRDLGISSWPLSQPGKGATFRVYAVDATLIRQLARSKHTSLRLLDDKDGDDEPILTWKDARAALADFVSEALD